MRLLLDAHISGKRVGAALRRQGHDVRAADEDRSLQVAPDEALLELAASEGRVIVTCDVADFLLLARRWAAEEKHHAGCVVFVGINNSEIGEIVRRLRRELAARPSAKDWADLTLVVGRQRAHG